MDVQNRLREEGLAAVLSKVFTQIKWGDDRGSRNGNGTNGGCLNNDDTADREDDDQDPSERPHGPGCDCNPESALKVQVRPSVSHCSYDSQSYFIISYFI